MAVLSKGVTISTGDQVTAANLNNNVDNATFDTPADNSTIQKNGSGLLQVKDSGVTPTKLSTGAPSWDSGGITTLTASDNSNYTATITNEGGDGKGLEIAAGSVGSSNATPLHVTDTASNTILKVQGDALVGINTSTPTEKLDINGNSIRIRSQKTPASASATGTTGAIAWDSSYIYVCVTTNTWKRSALSTW